MQTAAKRPIPDSCNNFYAKNKFLSRATAIVLIGPRQIGKPTNQQYSGWGVVFKKTYVEGNGHCCHRLSSN